MEKRKEEYVWWILVGVAAVITIFMHTYKICDIPYGLNVDEAGAAYDALNIARYGVDRWLNSYPVYFTNYGDGQNALYIYDRCLDKVIWRIEVGNSRKHNSCCICRGILCI